METDNFIEKLKQNINIVDVIGSYTVLKRNGNNYWARCPLPGHSERTPSFCINEVGQFYKCFGCGRGGDVIKFIQEVESVDFQEAVRILAERAQMELPEFKNVEKSSDSGVSKDRLYAVLKDTAFFYVHNLKNAPKHVKYLNKRNMDLDTIKTFGIGASLDYDTLPEYLKSKGYTPEEMVQAGVVNKNDKGEFFDCQAKRLIIPIIDNYGKVVGFGGRWIEASDNAKYKNTSETKVFIKNKVLYNLNNLKKLKNELGSIDNVIVVEGYMDTIAVYQKGVKNIVASMGTSLTKHQAKLLKRYTDRVTICYDGDFAGQKGAIRGLEILKEEGLDVKIAFIPDKMDPDDVINKYGVDAFNEIIKNAKPLIKFKLSLIEEKYGEKSNLPDKKKFIDLSIAIIRESDSAAEQEELLKELRDKTGITYESLKRDFEKGETPKSNYNDNFVIEKPKDTSDKILKAKRHILACALYKKDYVAKIDLEDFIFNHPVHEKMLEKILTGCTIQSACSGFTDEELGEVNMIISDENKIFGSSEELKYFEDCVTVIKVDELENELKELNKTFEQETNISSRQMLIKLIQDKTMQMVKLKKRRINS